MSHEKRAEDESSGMASRFKMQPWRDWQEWGHVYHLIFGKMGIVPFSDHGGREINLLNGATMEKSLKRALNIISMWLSRNVGGDKSKYLKM